MGNGTTDCGTGAKRKVESRKQKAEIGGQGAEDGGQRAVVEGHGTAGQRTQETTNEGTTDHETTDYGNTSPITRRRRAPQRFFRVCLPGRPTSAPAELRPALGSCAGIHLGGQQSAACCSRGAGTSQIGQAGFGSRPEGRAGSGEIAERGRGQATWRLRSRRRVFAAKGSSKSAPAIIVEGSGTGSTTWWPAPLASWTISPRGQKSSLVLEPFRR